jgi:hypothetical protein
MEKIGFKKPLIYKRCSSLHRFFFDKKTSFSSLGHAPPLALRVGPFAARKSARPLRYAPCRWPIGQPATTPHAKHLVKQMF